jgi:hypothetical protein
VGNDDPPHPVGSTTGELARKCGRDHVRLWLATHGSEATSGRLSNAEIRPTERHVFDRQSPSSILAAPRSRLSDYTLAGIGTSAYS